MESQAGASPYFSKQEQPYLSKLGAAMQNRVKIPVVRMWLKKAEAEGLDPQREPAPLFEIIIQDGGDILHPRSLLSSIVRLRHGSAVARFMVHCPLLSEHPREAFSFLAVARSWSVA